jgi:hypothetical protein
MVYKSCQQTISRFWTIKGDEKMPDDLYHCCQYCKWFSIDVCTNNIAFDLENDMDFFPFYESGVLSEAIKEGFFNYSFEFFEAALVNSGLPRTKRDLIIKTFRDELDEAILDWINEIDLNVSSALNHFDFKYLDGVYIEDPRDFSCKYFW